MKKLLLHSCCAPCSTHVIELLKSQYDLTILYYNPNIFPSEEYEKRLSEQKRLAQILDINVMTVDYNEEEFLSKVKGMELEKEGGARCEVCFELRMRETARLAKENGFDVFATTLSVSPHKSSYIISKVGNKIAEEFDIEYLDESFKKKDGYLNSIKLSKKYELYRQNYCGCRYSIRKDENGK